MKKFNLVIYNNIIFIYYFNQIVLGILHQQIKRIKFILQLYLLKNL
jgi:hypothetical protein